MTSGQPRKDFDEPNLKEPEEATEVGQMSRRKAVQYMVAAGGVAAVAGSLAGGVVTLFNPVVEAQGALETGFIYSVSAETKKEGSNWVVPLDGQLAAASHFKQVEDGAAMLWRAVLDEEGKAAPGTGIPAILLRVDPSQIKTSFDQLFSGIVAPGIIAFMSKCTHACCVPNWRLARKELRIFYCICHDSQYNPLEIVQYTHPTGVKYWGAKRIAGPAPRGIPVIPLQLDGDKIVGRIDAPGWYTYCGIEPPLDPNIDTGGS